MAKTRLYIECPNCHMQYLVNEIALTYSNGAYIERVAGAPEWQRRKADMGRRTRQLFSSEGAAEKALLGTGPPATGQAASRTLKTFSERLTRE
jgi:hypothetical protein